MNTQIPTDIAGYITNQFNSLRKQFDRRRRDFFCAGIKCIKAKRDTSRWEQAMTKWTTQRRADGLPEPTWLDHFVNEGHQREVDGPVVGLTTFREALTLCAEMILESNLDAKRDYLLSKNVDLLAEQIVGQIITEQSCTTETNIYLSVPYHTYSEHSFKQANEIVALVKAKGGKIACSVPFVAPQTESGDMRLMRAVFSDRVTPRTAPRNCRHADTWPKSMTTRHRHRVLYNQPTTSLRANTYWLACPICRSGQERPGGRQQGA